MSTLEMRMQLWNDNGGDRIEVGEDSDGLGLMEIRFVDDTNTARADIRFSLDDTPKVIEALQLVADYMNKQREKGRVIP